MYSELFRKAGDPVLLYCSYPKVIIWAYFEILLEFVGCCPLHYINYVRYSLL